MGLKWVIAGSVDNDKIAEFEASLRQICIFCGAKGQQEPLEEMHDVESPEGFYSSYTRCAVCGRCWRMVSEFDEKRRVEKIRRIDEIKQEFV